MARILITGAKGFIGRHAARHFAASKHRVAGIGHGAWLEEERAKWGVSDWVNGEVVAPNLDALCQAGGLPDYVIHLAGGSTVGASFQNPLEDFQRTVATTANLLEWLRLRSPRTKLVCVSSAAVYGSGYPHPIPETAPTFPYSPYGTHKFMMESLCRSYATNFACPVVITRLFSVYGPGLEKQFVWDVCNKLKVHPAKLMLDGTGRERRDWIHVQDVCRLFDHIKDQASVACPVVNGGTGIATPIAEVAAGIGAAFGTPLETVFSGRHRPGDPESLVAAVSALQDSGFTPRITLAQGLAATVAWFQESQRA